jgi:small multidrug resistance family-3 protein
MRNYAWYTVAAFAEIFGCYAFWLHFRAARSPVWLIPGVVSLVIFALALARIDTQFAARVYAAYGGIYIAASLIWLMVIEHARPTGRDLIGAVVSVAGAMIILSGRS